MKIGLAPMEGVVDFVIRDLFTSIGAYDECVTEFVRVTRHVLPASVYYRYCPELKTGGRTRSGVPVYVQILGGDPAVIADNAARAVELGALGIDLNFGCPAKTVNRHDGGASLLKNPERLYQVITEVKKTVTDAIPVSAKVRLGYDHKDFHLDIARAVDGAGAKKLTVHARTKMEGYRPPAHWEYVGYMRNAVSIPVVANGEIWNFEDLKRCMEVSGCEDIAIGRPAFACPDLAHILKNKTSNTPYKPLTWQRLRSEILPRFMEASKNHRSEHYAIARTKQWTKYLGKTYPEAGVLFEKIKRLKTYDEIAHRIPGPKSACRAAW